MPARRLLFLGLVLAIAAGRAWLAADGGPHAGAGSAGRSAPLAAVQAKPASVPASVSPAAAARDAARRRAEEQRLQREADAWVARTLKAMTLDEKIGQLIVSSIDSTFTSRDSDTAERLRHLVKDLKVGGFHVFGAGDPVPQLLLNPAPAGGSRRGDALAAAVLLNSLQEASVVPLLTTADFEGGVGYIVNGGTRLPRAMALGATRDPDLAFNAGQLSAREGRSLGVHVNFYPVVDVNNNPRNPIVNIRAFGEDPALVSEMARAYLRGIEAGGMLSTAKHFPGHGDTNVDTHIGLAVIDHPRARLDEVELPPFRAAIAEGVSAVMSSHIALPALDPTPGLPATLSRPILTGLLRDEMKFDGLVFTDSMSMHAISRSFPPDEAAAMAVKAGADIVLHSPDDDAAVQGIKAAVSSGEIPEAQITRSVERILRAKARLGLHRARLVDLAAMPDELGGRARAAVAAGIAERAITLIKDENGQVPLRQVRETALLYLSVVDYQSGWREGAPSRTFLPELRKRWPNVTAVEVSDRTTASEYDLIRALARRSDAVVASVFVRIASYSGRMDLSPAQVALLEWLATQTAPLVSVLFGNPYVATFVPGLPAVLLTYEVGDVAEAAAVRALAGESPIAGRLPIALPGLFPVGHGLTRPAGAAPSPQP
jgi:beta-glucosidase-like glycosyl hydrolase